MFPLGKLEDTDNKDALTTALREFHEETNGLFYSMRGNSWLHKLPTATEYLDGKLRAEYPSNSMYVKSGSCYMFFVEVSTKFKFETELLAPSESDPALEEKINNNLVVALQELSLNSNKTETQKEASPDSQIEASNAPASFVKRGRDENNTIEWVEAKSLLRQRTSKPGSNESDKDFHRFSCGIVYHPKFQELLSDFLKRNKEVEM